MKYFYFMICLNTVFILFLVIKIYNLLICAASTLVVEQDKIKCSHWIHLWMNNLRYGLLIVSCNFNLAHEFLWHQQSLYTLKHTFIITDDNTIYISSNNIINFILSWAFNELIWKWRAVILWRRVNWTWFLAIFVIWYDDVVWVLSHWDASLSNSQFLEDTFVFLFIWLLSSWVYTEFTIFACLLAVWDQWFMLLFKNLIPQVFKYLEIVWLFQLNLSFLERLTSIMVFHYIWGYIFIYY